MKEIIYILLDQYADHEMAFLSQAINTGEMGPRQHPKYLNRVMSLTTGAVTSIGGLRTLPDYTPDTMPDDYAALVLVGGYGWMDSGADRLAPVVGRAIADGRIVGAICNAASWMARHGLLNHVTHTGNGIDQLTYWGGERYTNCEGYMNEQAVSSHRIVTANGSGYLEFAREMLLLLENDTPEMIERYYQFNKQGLVKLFSPHPRFVFNTVGLFTRDNSATVDFYTKAFGMTTDWDGVQPNVEMYHGDMRIILFPRPAFEQMTGREYAYPDGINGTVEIALDVPTFADVDREYEHAISCGATPVMSPTTEPWGQRTSYVADPDGNLIEIGSFGGNGGCE